MNTRRILEWGGLAASVVLIVFGAAALYMGFDGRSTVQDSLKQEQIFFGDATDPAVAKYADQWAGQQVTNGDQARAFAKVMRMHTLEATGGLAYAQMGRFQSAANPSDQKGTNDETAAAKDSTGQPVANAARNIWVTETALTTALNTAFFAENVANFAIVMGFALLLVGVGFLVLTLVALRRKDPAPEGAWAASRAATTTG